MEPVAFLRSAGFYVAGFGAAVVLAFFLLGAGRERANAPDENRWANAVMAAYMLAVTALPGAAGFAAVACASRSWRELRAGAASPIAAGCGALGYVAWLTGLGALTGLAIPFPLGALGVALRLVLPGALLGGLALLAARALHGNRAVTH
jgi:hypothetical protein